MANAVWFGNVNLPQKTLKDGYSTERQSGVIRTDMDTGFPKVRRRFTALTKTYSITMIFTDAQYTYFENFFENDILYGANLVDFPHPRTGVNTEMRWLAPTGSPAYSVTPDGGTDDWRISFQLEELP